ncbi:MAG TPA: hypothetical protein VFG79_00980 [Solirubrobacter sp.]|nr:hypothetical protein [Solirubrobacter sp.]
MALGIWLAGAPAAEAANLFTTIGVTRSETRGNSQIYGNPTPYSLPAEEMPTSGTVVLAPNDDADDVPLRMPDTSGTKPNLAAFQGQVLQLPAEAQKAYAKIHFFGTTTDGGPAGGDFVLHYSDDSTQTINVRFPDWCSGSNDSAHWAIGPLSQRYRTEGSDGARCGIFHFPADAQPGKTLTSVTLPSSTSPGDPPIQAYLFALTLQAPDGVYTMPDLSGAQQFPNDHDAPVTTHELDPEAPNANGWYTEPIEVTFESTDTGGAGVEQTLWRVDGGQTRVYPGRPFDYDVEGEHRLEYRSIDAAGNAEDYKGLTLKLDARAPETTATTRPQRTVGTWHDGPVTVSLQAVDGTGSGPATTDYRVDGGAWQAYDAPFAVEPSGVHAVEYRTTDVAGNIEPTQSMTLRVDGTAPVTTARVNGATPLGTYPGPVRIAFTRTDVDGSGAVKTEYRLDDGGWTEYRGAFDVDAAGGHRVDYRSRDAAGNIENYRMLLFAISSPAFAAPQVVTIKPIYILPAPAAEPQPYVSAAPRKPRHGRVRVRIACQSVDRGTLKLTVSRATKRRLHLKRRTLVRRTTRCGEDSRSTVTLKPNKRVRRALRRSKRSVRAKLTLRFGAARDTQTVTFRGKS